MQCKKKLGNVIDWESTKQRQINTQSPINGSVHNDIFRDRFTKNIEWNLPIDRVEKKYNQNKMKGNEITSEKNAHDPVRSNCVIFANIFLLFFEWIHLKCMCHIWRQPIKTNKISVRYLLNFGLISIMPFHQCTIVWTEHWTLNMFRVYRCLFSLFGNDSKARGKIYDDFQCTDFLFFNSDHSVSMYSTILFPLLAQIILTFRIVDSLILKCSHRCDIYILLKWAMRAERKRGKEKKRKEKKEFLRTKLFHLKYISI